MVTAASASGFGQCYSAIMSCSLEYRLASWLRHMSWNRRMLVLGLWPRGAGGRHRQFSKLTPVTHPAGRCWPAVLIVACCGSSWTTSAAALAVLASGSPRPDGAGVFRLAADDAPALDGDDVVFRAASSSRPGRADSVWRLRITDGRLTKLVGYNDAVPGDSGRFTAFDADVGGPQVDRGIVLFAAEVRRREGMHSGLYAVPSGGGTIRRVVGVPVVGRAQAAPAPGVLDASARLGAFTLDAGRVAFAAQDAVSRGIFVSTVAGTDLTAVALTESAALAAPQEPNPESDIHYGSPDLSGNLLVFWAGIADGSNAGRNGVYLRTTQGLDPASSPVVSDAAWVVADWTSTLPAATPLRGLTFLAAQLDAPWVAFSVAARLPSGAPFGGIYAVDTQNGQFRKVVDSIEVLPGLTGPAVASSLRQFSLDGGEIAFTAADARGGSALYVWNAGAPAPLRLFGHGDALGGQGFNGTVAPVHRQALDGGRVAVALVDADGGLQLAVFATQTARADLRLHLRTPQPAGFLTAPFVIEAVVTNLGPAVATQVVLDGLLAPGLRLLRSTGCGAIHAAPPCQLDTLMPGASHTVQWLVRSRDAGAVIQNHSVQSAQTDPDISNNRATLTIEVQGLRH